MRAISDVPEAAQEALTQVVDFICQEIVLGRFRKEEWWTAIKFFQQDISMSVYAILAQCWSIDVHQMTTDDWLELVEIMVPLEDKFKFATDEKVFKTYSKTMRLLRIQLILSHFRGEKRVDKYILNSSLKALKTDQISYAYIKNAIEMNTTDREVAMTKKPLSLDYFSSKVFREYLPYLMQSVGDLECPASVLRSVSRRTSIRNAIMNVAANVSAYEEATSIANEQHTCTYMEEEASRSQDRDHLDSQGPFNQKCEGLSAEALARNQTNKESSKEALRKLQSARKHLRDDVTDPLQEMREVARKAKRTKSAASLYEKKKTARALEFDGSDSDVEGPKLSSVPAKMTHPSPPPNVEHITAPRLHGTRRVWTVDEKNAVKQGIIKLGCGKWSEIKSEYAEILRYRTAVNIKDCFRTMLRTGELSA